MSKPLIICKHFPGKCFGSVAIGGTYYCNVLSIPIKDHPCPFYKTQLEYELQIPHGDKPRVDYIDDEEVVLTELFSGWVSVTNAIDWEDEDRKAQLRCAIAAYSHRVQDILVGVYNVDQEESEMFKYCKN